jgi:chromosome segregation ATPase
MRLLSSLTAIALVVGLVACSSQKEPAEAAVKAAQDAFAAVSGDAMKYVPDQARAIQNGLTSAQDALTKGDYAAALTQAQALPAQITAVGAAVSAKKAELTTAWNSMSAGLPKMIDALKSRVDTLSKSKGVPAGLTKETIANAKTGLATVTQTWTDATAAATAGDIQAAVTQANDVKAKVIELMKSLNMQVPPGAGGI